MRSALALVGLIACDVAAPDAGPAAHTADAEGPAEIAEVGGLDEVLAHETSPPSPRAEAVISEGAGVGEARDDLFPDLAGDDLVWIRVWLDTSIANVDAATDCMTCPGCHGCRFDVVHRRLPDGPARTLDSGRMPRTGPRVGGGLASWVDDEGRILVRNLAGDTHEIVTTGTWLQAAPVPFDGKLWWRAWDNASQRHAVFVHDIASATRERAFSAELFDPYWVASSQLAQLAQRQPFSIGAHGVDFVATDDAQSVRRWAWQGSPEVLLTQAERVFARVLQRADGTVVTAGYPASTGCVVGQCELALHALDRAGIAPIAPDARPSLYTTPVVGGDTVVWLDRRDGRYQVHAAGPDGAERRLSSELAEIGAVSTLAANARGAVWADRRSGRWRLVWRAFAD